MINENQLKSNSADGAILSMIAHFRAQYALKQHTADCRNAYQRTVILEVKDLTCPCVIVIPRKWDPSRKHRDTLLPEGLLRHTPFSIYFIFSVLLMYVRRVSQKLTIQELCRRAGISISTLYRWKMRYRDRFLLWLRRHRRSAPEAQGSAVTADICQTLEIYSEFQTEYTENRNEAAAFSQ